MKLNDTVVKITKDKLYDQYIEELGPECLVFVSEAGKERLSTLDSTFYFIPGDGVKGQVLKKSESGFFWDDLNSIRNHNSIGNISIDYNTFIIKTGTSNPDTENEIKFLGTFVKGQQITLYITKGEDYEYGFRIKLDESQYVNLNNVYSVDVEEGVWSKLVFFYDGFDMYVDIQTKDVFTAGDPLQSILANPTNVVKNQYELSVGRYNNSTRETSNKFGVKNSIFTVGNGESENGRHDAFVVCQDGSIYVPLTLDKTEQKIEFEEDKEYYEKPTVCLQNWIDGKMDKPETEGVEGQILTKTEDGIEWADAKECDTSDLEKRVSDIETAIDIVEKQEERTNVFTSLSPSPETVYRYSDESQRYEYVKVEGFTTLNPFNSTPLIKQHWYKVPKDIPDDVAFLIIQGSTQWVVTGKEAKAGAVNGYYKATFPTGISGGYFITAKYIDNNGTSYADVVIDIDPAEKYSNKIKTIEKVLEIEYTTDNGFTISNNVQSFITTSEGVKGQSNEKFNTWYNIVVPPVSQTSGNYFLNGSFMAVKVDDSYPDGYALIWDVTNNKQIVSVEEAKKKTIDGYYLFEIVQHSTIAIYYDVIVPRQETTNPALYKEFVKKIVRTSVIDTIYQDISKKITNPTAVNDAFLHMDNTGKISWKKLEDYFEPYTESEVMGIFGIFVPELNTAYIKVWNSEDFVFNYYKVDKYEAKENETPIGVSIKTTDCPEGFTIALKWGNYDTPDEGSDDVQYMGYGCQDVELEDVVTTADISTRNKDYEGRKNTDVVLQFATDPADWKTSATIDKSPKENHPTAVMTAWRYSTPGTKQGSWYIPAAGQLYESYMYSSKITAAFTKLGIDVSEKFVWSSTPSNNANMWGNKFLGNSWFNYGRGTSQYVKPYSKF